jgi:hypothetical protein
VLALRLRHKLLLLEAMARQKLGRRFCRETGAVACETGTALRCATSAIEIQRRLQRAHAAGPNRHAAVRTPRHPPALLLAAEVHLALAQAIRDGSGVGAVTPAAVIALRLEDMVIAAHTPEEHRCAAIELYEELLHDTISGRYGLKSAAPACVGATRCRGGTPTCGDGWGSRNGVMHAP